MNKFFRPILLMVLVFSCAEDAKTLDFKDEEKVRIQRGNASNTNIKKDKTIALSFTANNITPDAIELATAFTFNTGSLVYVADPSGKTRAFDISTKILGELYTSDKLGDFDQLYDYPTIGHVGFTASEVSYRIDKDSLILNQSWDNQNATIMSVYPGFVSYYDTQAINLIFEQGANLKRFRLDLTEKENNAMFGACQSGCVVWKLIEDKLIIGVANGGITSWEEYKISLEGIEFSKIKSLYLSLTYTDENLEIIAGSGLTLDGRLLLVEPFSNVNLFLAENNTSDLLTTYCEPCHQVSIDSLNDRKRVIASLTADPTVSPMPPDDGYWDKALSRADRLKLIDYIESIDAPNEE